VVAKVTSRREILLDAGIGLAAFAATLAVTTAIVDNAGGSIETVEVVLMALSTLPLALRRFSPVGTFLLTALASSALAAVTEDGGPPFGPTIALYWLAEGGDGSRDRNRFVLALVAAMLLLHVAAGGLARDAFPGTELLFGVLVWGGAWLAGDRTRLRRERMAELEERARRAEREAERERRLAAAEERTRIARDLHDSAGHAINVILVHAGLGRLRTGDDPEGTRQEFETIEEVARETVGQIDQMVGALREDGSEPDVEPPGLAALPALVERHRAAGLDVTTSEAGERRPLPPGVDRGAYRILQEALTNAARHGDGRARVEIAYGPTALGLTVANGVPAVPGDRTAGGGHGLTGMRERASLIGGRLEVGPHNGGFRVHAELPLEST
jgi:signal transduction histidine kinase